jgi:hypothetical protein
MMCFAAAFGLLGIAAMRRVHHCGRGDRRADWDSPFGRDDRRERRHGRGSRWMVQALLRRIDASPAQARAIVDEVDKLADRVQGARAGAHDARADLAAALRGPVLDDAALGAALGRIDAALGETRSAAIDAVRGVHALLDDRQRGELATLIEHGDGWWRRRDRRGSSDTPAMPH